MSGIAKVVVPLAKRIAPLLLAYGPKVVEAVRVGQRYLADHPEIPAWFRKRIESVQQQLTEAADKRGSAAQIRAALAVVRTESSREGSGLDAGLWAARADAIEGGLRVAELRSGAAKKASMEDLKSRTDDLAADLLDAMVPGSPKEP